MQKFFDIFLPRNPQITQGVSLHYVGDAPLGVPALDLFKSANRYLNKHRNAEGKIPLAAWIKERDKLMAEKKEISKSTMSLSARLRQIDRIRKSARESLPKQPQRNRGWEVEH